MRILILLIGTALGLLLIIKLIQGRKYDYLLEGLDNDSYPFYALYGVGYAWNQGKLFHIRESMQAELQGQAKLLYEPQYADYYAALTWAQILTFGHLSLCAGFLLSGALNTGLLAVAGIAMAVVCGIYFSGYMKEKLAARQGECTSELPEIVSTMALLINSGMVLKEVWEIVAYSKDSEIYLLMQEACADMRNGSSEIEAIQKFGIMTNSPETKKFTSSLIQGMEKGSKELSEFLAAQSTEMWDLKKQIMLQKGEKAASKLLVPILFIFGGVLVIVIAAAVGMLI